MLKEFLFWLLSVILTVAPFGIANIITNFIFSKIERKITEKKIKRILETSHKRFVREYYDEKTKEYPTYSFMEIMNELNPSYKVELEISYSEGLHSYILDILDLYKQKVLLILSILFACGVYGFMDYTYDVNAEYVLGIYLMLGPLYYFSRIKDTENSLNKI